MRLAIFTLSGAFWLGVYQLGGWSAVIAVAGVCLGLTVAIAAIDILDSRRDRRTAYQRWDRG